MISGLQRMAAVGRSLVLPLALGACAGPRELPVSDAHITQEHVQAGDVLPIPSTVLPSAFVPLPLPEPLTYSVVVHEVPVQELLLALARDTRENIDIHPGLQGVVTLNAIDQPLPAILDRMAEQVNMRYRIEGHTVFVSPDTPYLRTYQVDHVNLMRDTNSTISVSGQISASGGEGSAATSAGGSSQTSVTSTSRNNFWEVLVHNLQRIVSASRALSESSAERQARAEALVNARRERIAQAGAVAAAGDAAKELYRSAFGNEAAQAAAAPDADILINQVAGIVSVMATQREHALVQRYLEGVKQAAERQVLIECTIVEVTLSQAYQAGIDWQQVIRRGQGWRLSQELLGNALGAAPRMVLGYGNGDSDLQVTVRLLERFGRTRVLSSPKIMALNNQTALLKVVDNVVYFTVASSVSQNQTQTLQSVTTTPSTVAVGVVLSLTPQIDAARSVNLIVRPTISRISRFVDDPNPLLKVDAQGEPLANPIANRVPEIQVREMESVIRLMSRQTAVLGGLIQEGSRHDRDQVPGIGRIPRAGDAFAYRDEASEKTELVIFLRPTVVTNPSIQSAELRHLQPFLPQSPSSATR
jgi:general secretion pathway protein D